MERDFQPEKTWERKWKHTCSFQGTALKQNRQRNMWKKIAAWARS